MTVKEAIFELNFALGEIYDQVFYDDKPYEFDKDEYEALDMAIKALKQQQIIHCKDCKHFSRTLFLGSGYNRGECHRDTAMRPGVGDVMRPDDYCSRAERKTE